jgi:hypothetical protein
MGKMAKVYPQNLMMLGIMSLSKMTIRLIEARIMVISQQADKRHLNCMKRHKDKPKYKPKDKPNTNQNKKH